MSAYRTQQHRLVHRGRTFHFVSYEGKRADPQHLQPEVPPAWYVMLAGKRWIVGPQVGEPVPSELDFRFREWLDTHVFSAAPAVESQRAPSVGAATLAGPAEAARVAVPVARE
jgi:hypothetical protein